MNEQSEHGNQALCFSLDDLEAQNIISQRSLFENCQNDNPTVSLTEEKSKMTYLEKKEIRLKWHGIALSEYWRNKQIPRGLRMNKKPTMGNQDPEFRKKWDQILNKCWLDLTLLIIEQTKLETQKVNADLQELKTTLKSNMSKADYTKMETDLKDELTKFEDELKAYKIKKYQRDAEDYKRGTIYNWTTNTQRSRRPRAYRDTRATGARGQQGDNRRRQHRDLFLTSEEGTSEQDHTSASSADEAFLGRDRAPVRKQGGGGGRGAHPASRIRSMQTRSRNSQR